MSMGKRVPLRKTRTSFGTQLIIIFTMTKYCMHSSLIKKYYLWNSLDYSFSPPLCSLRSAVVDTTIRDLGSGNAWTVAVDSPTLKEREGEARLSSSSRASEMKILEGHRAMIRSFEDSRVQPREGSRHKLNQASRMALS